MNQSATQPIPAADPSKWLPVPIPISEQTWPVGTKPVVSIICITYNHDKFIRECLDGFLMQETTFPVEILVHDDASTDHTADILREYAAQYPTLFRLYLQTENQYSQGIAITPILCDLASGELIAFCEGDDYWFYPQKLLQQENILRVRHDLVMVSHGCKRAIDGGGDMIPWLRTKGLGNKEYTDLDILLGVFDLMQTWLIRKPCFDQRFLKMRKSFPVGDTPYNLYLLQNGSKGLSLEKLWSCYRQHPGGIWSPLSVFSQHLKHLVGYVVHKGFYGAKYADSLGALAKQTRVELTLILASNLMRFKWALAYRDISLFFNFASEYFHPRKEIALVALYLPRSVMVAVGRKLEKFCTNRNLSLNGR